MADPPKGPLEGRGLHDIIRSARREGLLAMVSKMKELDPELEIDEGSTVDTFRKILPPLLRERSDLRLRIPGLEHLRDGSSRLGTPVIVGDTASGTTDVAGGGPRVQDCSDDEEADPVKTVSTVPASWGGGFAVPATAVAGSGGPPPLFFPPASVPLVPSTLTVTQPPLSFALGGGAIPKATYKQQDKILQLQQDGSRYPSLPRQPLMPHASAERGFYFPPRQQAPPPADGVEIQRAQHGTSLRDDLRQKQREAMLLQVQHMMQRVNELDDPRYECPREPQRPVDGRAVREFLKEARLRNLKFAGAPKESARDFLRKLESLVNMCGLASPELLMGVAELLEGSAERWFRTNEDTWESWQHFRQSFQENYVRTEPDAVLLQQLLQRRQAECERPLHFLATLKEINSQLEVPLEEGRLLGVARQNLHPTYQQPLALYQFESLAHLERSCTMLEASVASVARYAPPPTELLQHADFGDPSLTRGAVKVAPMVLAAVSPNCFNCDLPGHLYKDCSRPRLLFCSFCGKKNVSTAMCCRARYTRPAGSGLLREPRLEGGAPSAATAGGVGGQTNDVMMEILRLLKEMHVKLVSPSEKN